MRFTSSPELPEEEVLAHLLFGQGIENISALQAARLAAAVATLAGRGGDGIVGKLRKSFGLDDLDLATDAEGGTTLRAASTCRTTFIARLRSIRTARAAST